MMDASFWVGVFSITTINLLLSGDNALVIALASRNLPARQQRSAVFWGGVGAIILRIILTLIAIFLLQIPYLQLLGGLLLLWVAIKLISDKKEPYEEIEAANSLWAAVKTILVADLVMSLDNVLAIAGIAKGNVPLLVIGLGISIPIIIWGSKAIMLLMERWSVIILLGAAFLGWTAGEMVLADKQVEIWLAAYSWAYWAVPALFAAVVVVIDLIQKQRDKERGSA
ncbi:Integral membrane protein TerC [Thermosinus carboxydivorans Nor1]|uniref:Integral membrane protein TerC n=1 Tax=Thermosinus carboxydivorans Nor1 TaxID=401526 RepID=A1HQX5_9FIRM|nr:TerC family protein [Thermosinus carboxydivorans]EAX47484.1 Integral membrane protein TerC [Thermosinus carboxydivorans Nor1]